MTILRLPGTFAREVTSGLWTFVLAVVAEFRPARDL
jgi:hypothetical protein